MSEVTSLGDAAPGQVFYVSGASETKRCPKCTLTKAPSEFYRSSSETSGLDSRCKQCRRAYVATNREWATAYMRSYRARNKDKVASWRRDLYAKNPERAREYSQRWREAHPDQVKAACAAFRAANRDLVTKRNKESRQRNRDRYLAGLKAWHAANPGKMSAYAAERRARVVAATIGDREAIAAIYRLCRSVAVISCHWCNADTVSRSDRHVDHRIPLSRGGQHEASNLVIACCSCNVRKNNKMPDEWRRAIDAEAAC